MTEPKKRGRRAGSVNSPEHNAAISAYWAEYRGFTDQEIIAYYGEPHTIRECAEWFGLTFQRIRQILMKYSAARPRGAALRRRGAFR